MPGIILCVCVRACKLKRASCLRRKIMIRSDRHLWKTELNSKLGDNRFIDEIAASDGVFVINRDLYVRFSPVGSLALSLCNASEMRRCFAALAALEHCSGFVDFVGACRGDFNNLNRSNDRISQESVMISGVTRARKFHGLLGVARPYGPIRI